MKKQVTALLLLLCLLLNACAIPLKESTAAEERPEKTAAETEAATAAGTEAAAAETDPAPAAQDPERIALIRTIQTSVRAASSNGTSSRQKRIMTVETYFSAEGLPTRITYEQRTVDGDGERISGQMEAFIRYHFDEKGRLDRIVADDSSGLPVEVGLEWEEENGLRIRFFFLNEGKKVAVLTGNMIASAAGILQIFQYYDAFADAELVFEGTESRILIKGGRPVSQMLQQNETFLTGKETEEAEGLVRIRNLTRSGNTEIIMTTEYDQENRMLRMGQEQNGKGGTVVFRYESETENGRRTDRAYIDSIEADEDEMRQDMAEYEGMVLAAYHFDEQGRMTDFIMYEGKRELPSQITYYDTEGRTVRQENFTGGSYEDPYISETEYRKISEIDETIKLTED